MSGTARRLFFIITGTTRGLGRSLAAAALDQAGSRVVGFSRAAPFLKNDRQQNVSIDLNDTDAIAAAFDQIAVDRQENADLAHSVLINNAGVLDPIAPVADCDDRLLAENIRVNLTAPLLLTRHFFHFAKGLPGRKWIVNITSGASQAPYPGWAAYGAAKAGLDLATRTMALEFASIDPAFAVCAVAPGTVDTDMQARIRRCSHQQFPQVDKFIDLKANGGLTPPFQAARRLIKSLLAGRFENGGRYDLRTMHPA
ncbi:putative Benzil reductase ((S)-benzoin forming) [Desulfosarcina cetonica]|uniref:SDR family NAD(P)-dependent oxidoreductase n=1 Tax=Desulfosarcina cetonica TaxID=90730 RepID=UPI0006D0A727|nr:SDR family NAD(P)-dependent oxidoreductase [Desulfosarcina cetonica]VTR65809.1 putative Benzil reductase ((S)-benzoin forming) [Desulfosarcina cetonica]